jgi:cyclase
MLKPRLIPCIVTRDEMVVQSINFKKYLPIGNIKTAIEFFVNWDVDEIVILDITASKENRSPNIDLIEWASTECFVPLTVGGGIKTSKDIRALLNSGADKVCINSSARNKSDLIEEASNIFGTQCITVSVDAIYKDGEYKVYTYEDDDILDISLISYVKQLEKQGAGEIFLNSVDRDGSKEGYDIRLLKSVADNVNIPVIACGGVGKNSHFSEAIISANCSAVSAANIFQHTEHSTISAKAMLLKDGVEVRLNGSVKYSNFEFDHMGRPF